MAKRFPQFNASLDGDDLVLKRYVHIGFAADTPNGLLFRSFVMRTKKSPDRVGR